MGCPALPGCWSQGTTEDEALANIREAIQDYLAAVNESLKGPTSAKFKWRSSHAETPGGFRTGRRFARWRKLGSKIVRQSGHVVLSNGTRFVVVPRNNPVNAFTMGGIARDAGFTVNEFRKFL